VEPKTPTYETGRYGEVPVADAIATREPETGAVTLFAVNRSEAEPVRLTASLRGLPPLRVVDHQILGGEGLDLANTAEAPERVTPRAGAGSAMDGGTLTVPLPPVSWSMIRLAP
jgi:alpha-N-arabinofuranosidase